MGGEGTVVVFLRSKRRRSGGSVRIPWLDLNLLLSRVVGWGDARDMYGPWCGTVDDLIHGFVFLLTPFFLKEDGLCVERCLCGMSFFCFWVGWLLIPARLFFFCVVAFYLLFSSFSCSRSAFSLRCKTGGCRLLFAFFFFLFEGLEDEKRWRR